MLPTSDVRTLWFTGLSGAGKTTLAQGLLARYQAAGRPALVLDGDQMRQGLNRDLGFAREDRLENARRLAEVAKLLNAAGVTAIVAIISPYADDRAMARKIVGAPFAEIHLDASIQVCAARDVKGWYARAAAGDLPGFTGVSAPYEPPSQPDLVVHTGGDSVDACLATLGGFLRV
ncbi:adenylyl-sulfate kinase [Pigmentiphaga aceris]|uniref:adenylyl-sulfate kinase n=1 Tax=Pigmentiphaga aceris TaxID=1940612 RepID=UPI001FE98036|nr:adenylyl-sulfate kinase [Pigmentiphaga aceris]